MKIIATIEARMGSSRLPGKSIKKILGKPMLELLIERVKRSKFLDEIIIATSTSKQDDKIEKLANSINVNCFRGSEEDVLERVVNAVKSRNGDVIVELWGDNPLIDPEIIDDLIQFYMNNKYDCVGTTLPNFQKTYPLGISAIIFSTKILEQVEKITDELDDRENVSNYIYEHVEKYTVAPLPCPKELNFPEISLTVDQIKDFELIKKIFEALYPINNTFNTHDVIKFLNENPRIKEINSDVIRKRLTAWKKFE